MGVGIIESETSDLSKYFEAIKEDKQEFNVPQEPEISEEQKTSEAEYLEPEEIHKIKSNYEFSKIPAATIVSILDGALKGVCSVISGEKETGADKEEKETLTDAFAGYLKDKNAELSPGLVLILTVSVIYVPKIFTSYQVRKLKKEVKNE